MTLIEILALQVGPAIAKAILKLWLKDSGILADTGASIVDIVKDKTSDVLAQQRARRQLEAIGEKVAESLLPILEVEGRSSDGDNRPAIALAVAEALNNAPIDAAIIAQHNLEPSRLAEHLLSKPNKSLAYFSDDEIGLYRRMIFESCRYIVDIAAQFPSFTERTFAEVLKREDVLLTVANQTLEEVRRIIRQSSWQMGQDAARFETEYRLGVARVLDRLELFGLDVSSASRRHRLSVAYVTLSVRQESNKLVDKPALHGRARTGQPFVVSVNRALIGSRRLFVKGMAGSGKTTLLQWIAVRSAVQDFPIELAELNETVPFFIRLRQCVDTGLPVPEHFPYFVTPAIAGTMPDQWVHEQLRTGRAIVMLDGVDEVPEKLRKEAYSWLEELVSSFPEARYIVTSRPYAVSDEWLTNQGFDSADLQPMVLAAIDEFIDHWHKAVRDELSDAADKTDLDKLPSHLKNALRYNRAIHQLATSPLLCAMLCALQRDRSRQLPSDRIELYEAACYMLLERRDIERHVELTDYPRLAYRQKSALLQDLAYWMHTNGWSEVSRARASDRLARRLAQIGESASTVTGDKIYRLFVERSGIVREPIVDQLDFAHRTFQEFLAAQAALDEDNIGVLIRNAHDDQWREIIILAAGLARSKERDELIDGLIARGYREKAHRYRLHLLAIACLETMLGLKAELRTKAHKHLAQLVPPKDMEEAQQLASTGELAVPHLAAQKGQEEEVAAACVRTLVLIGGDAALTQLVKYGDDARESVIHELVRGLNVFDRKDYGLRVLSKIKSLKLTNTHDLYGFQYLRGLTHLELMDSVVSDLSPLSELGDLQVLGLTRCAAVSDLSPISRLRKLTRLHLDDCTALQDIAPIAVLAGLVELSLKGCTLVTDITPLATMRSLSTLDLRHSGISDLRPLSSLQHLAALDLRDCVQIKDLMPLKNLRQLTQLKLEGIPEFIVSKWKSRGGRTGL